MSGWKYREVAGDKAWTFDYDDTELIGVTPDAPILAVDSHVDTSRFSDFDHEIRLGLARYNERYYRTGIISGEFPPGFEEWLGNSYPPESILYHLESRDPDGRHRRALESLPDRESRMRYLYYALGLAMPWHFFFTLREARYPYFANAESLRIDPRTGREYPEWEPDALRAFPGLIEYIRTLPIKRLGRVILYGTFPRAGVPVHRDTVPGAHRDHALWLSPGGSRRFFVYDPKTRKKHYLPDGSRAYVFNNRDYHGIDPEPVFGYTVRIDCEFTEGFSRQIGLRDGYIGDPKRFPPLPPIYEDEA